MLKRPNGIDDGAPKTCVPLVKRGSTVHAMKILGKNGMYNEQVSTRNKMRYNLHKSPSTLQLENQNHQIYGHKPMSYLSQSCFTA